METVAIVFIVFFSVLICTPLLRNVVRRQNFVVVAVAENRAGVQLPV